MGLFKKKASDPISARAEELNARIQALESEIKHLNRNLQPRNSPRVRSTALPEGRGKSPQPNTPLHDSIFEPVETTKPPPEMETPESHYNEFGVRKYDLLGSLKRLKKYLTGEQASNPKLVSYLAAGSIKGLRPLRYEKRVARNRFIFLSLFFVLILWGILALIFNNR